MSCGGSKCASELHVPVAVDFKPECAARMAWMRMHKRRGHEACMCMREVSRSQQEEMSRNMHKRRTAKACEYVSPVKRRLSYSEHAIQCGLRDTVYAIVAPAGQGVPSFSASQNSICVQSLGD